MKKLTFLVSIMFLCLGTMMAQTTVSGTITDDTGEALIGASVLAKGTSVGTITDIDGRYTITLPDGVNTLVVSYVGYTETDVLVSGPGELNVTMASNSELIDEIVVTGLGIKREKKALGYGITTIGAADIELKPEADVSRVLRGKVPGVDILSTSGLAGSGTNVVIRGYSSISGSNQALFVVDGVPFSSGTDSDRTALQGNGTTSSRFLDIDPNNIAEVSVLKGLSATVLYGEAGRNGVILITTKNGQSNDANKGFEVTVNQSVYSNTIASLPEDQDLYGNGFWNNASAAFSNWGAPFDPGVHATLINAAFENGQTGYDLSDGTIPHPYSRANLNDVLPQYVDARYAYQAYDNLQGFFQDGLTTNTSVFATKSLGDNSSINFSFAKRNDEGFVPLSTLDRTNVSLGARTKFANKITLSTTLNYVALDKVAPPTSTSTSSNPNDGASLFSNVFYTPRSVDLNGLEYENPLDGSSIFYRGGNDITNAYWTLFNSSDNEIVNRIYGTIAAGYELTEGVNLNYRLGFDNYSQTQRYELNRGGGQVPDGLLETSNRNTQILDHNFNVAVYKGLTESLDLDAVAGVNLRHDATDRTLLTSTNQFVFGLLTHDNFIDHISESATITENLIGAYVSATLGFNNFLYLNLAGRNDWTSTLEEANRSFFYPSASLSFIASEAIPGLQNNNMINYLKVRVGYGTSAGYPSPYSTRNTLAITANEFVDASGTIINTNSVNNVFGNPDLTPELHQEVEVGLEARFFKNRLGVDLSLYNKDSKDLILDFPMDPSTGFTQTTINVAEVNNRGIELGLNVNAIRTTDFYTNFNFNITKNINTVVALADGVDDFITDALFSNLGPAFFVDEPYGVIVGEQVLRDEASGLPIVSSAGFYQTSPELGIIADPNPNYTLNGGASIGFKGLVLAAQLAYQDGGEMYATGPSTLLARGILQETDFDRFVPLIAPGLIANADGDLVPNTIQITSTDHYWRNGGVFIQEQRVYDATYLKLREISLSYGIPASILEKTPFGSASLTLSGQNLWFRAYGFPEGANFDPEVLSTGVGNFRGLELMNAPASRSVGGSLKITF